MVRSDNDPSNTVFLLLGSNIEPETNLPAAVKLLDQMTNLVAISSVWETKPVGLLEQPNFLNAAVLVTTPLEPILFKRTILNNIERKLKRIRRANKNAPRTIDLDIALFNRQVIKLGNSWIPDPDIFERPFVAIPLAELAPTYIHPLTGETLQKIADGFQITDEEMRLQPKLTQALKQRVAAKEIITVAGMPGRDQPHTTGELL